jgi:hypothetical protein
VRIELCTFSHSSVPTPYQVELDNTGDAVVLKQCHFFNVGNDPDTPLNSIKVTNNAVSIENCLPGNMHLINCSGLSSISNSGTDGGQWIIERSHIKIEKCSLTALDTAEALEFRNDTNFTYSAVLDQIIFTHDQFRGEWEPNLYDIKTANGYNIDIRNVYRSIVFSNDPKSRNLLGVQVEDEAGSALAAFNDYSHFYSRKSRIEDQKVVIGNVDHPLPQLSLNAFTNLALFASDTWEAATDTYFYRVVVYWDVARSISRSNLTAERSLALTNSGDSAVLEIGDSNYSGNMIVRVYRGLSTGVYDNFADIPVVDSPSLVDNGNTIAGVAWQSRTPGAATTANVLNLRGVKISPSGQVSIQSTAPPTTGTWTEGDLVENTALSVDGNNMVLEGWKRLTTGTGHVLGTDWSRRYVSDVSPAT